MLGASNVVRSLPTIVETARRSWREPIEMMVAMGHGRSYGEDSVVFGRKISGIFPCALWRDLHSRAALPTTALITDIGNDLLFGVTPQTLVSWVEGCLERLVKVEAQIVVTLLPASSIETLGERRFAFFRRMLFPRSKLTLADAKAHVREINERLMMFDGSRNISVIPVSGQWYGLDPIHLLRKTHRAAWPAILAGWRAAGEPLQLRRASLFEIAYLSALAPLERSQFGFTLHTVQPCGRFFDGTTISLY